MYILVIFQLANFYLGIIHLCLLLGNLFVTNHLLSRNLLNEIGNYLGNDYCLFLFLVLSNLCIFYMDSHGDLLRFRAFFSCDASFFSSFLESLLFDLRLRLFLYRLLFDLLFLLFFLLLGLLFCRR